jgi:hypothetical protein
MTIITRLPIPRLKVVEEFHAQGHRNVLAKHQTTFEFTKDAALTRRGDCVIAVNATKGLREMSVEFRQLCRNDETRILVELRAAGRLEVIEGKGTRRLALDHPTDMVGRKSSYASERTFMIHADRAACDIDRDLISVLRSPETKLLVRLVAVL